MKYIAYLFAFGSSLAANTLIQFGGDEQFIANANWQAQIGADQIVDWAGNRSVGGAASGNVGGASGQWPGTRKSETYGLTLSSVSVVGASPMNN